MAQLVVVEPGDVLVFGGQAGFDAEPIVPLLDKLRELFGVSLVLVLEGPVDLGVIRQEGLEDGVRALARP